MRNIFALLLSGLAVLASCSKNATGTAASAGVDSLVHADWSRNAVIYEVNTRQYTEEGTFNAFARHLPRLKELGVDILWFMPIHPISELNRKGELGSYYAVRDYKAVNPEFGTFADFKAVVDSAHAQGMKVLIDWVPNHTGCDNAWVTDHPEYYKRNDNGEMFGPFDWTDVYELDYSNEATCRAMIDAMTYWITQAGIDGFRCDVAGRVPTDFWNRARRELEAAAGDRSIFMLAEATEPELTQRAFDMVYNWPMKDLFTELAATQGQYSFVKEGEQPRTFPSKKAAAIDSLMAEQTAQYPADAYMMNMTSNHDLNSWEGTEYQRLGIFAPAFAVLTYILPGMPLIYTGQEAGLDRALEFFIKDTPPQWGEHADIFAFYQKLNALKHSRKELAAGSVGAPLCRIDVGGDIYAFTRSNGETGTLVAVNLTSQPQPATIEASISADCASGAIDIFTDAAPDNNFTLLPGEYRVITYNVNTAR